MPAVSKAQHRFLWANVPKVAAEFSRDMPRGAFKRLPEHAKAKGKSGGSANGKKK